MSIQQHHSLTFLTDNVNTIIVIQHNNFFDDNSTENKANFMLEKFLSYKQFAEIFKAYLYYIRNILLNGIIKISGNII